MSNNQTKTRPFFAAAKNHPEVIAHRGGAAEWPAETIYAFRQAINLGVDVLEFDVRRTADDEIVLMHNPTVDETTDGSGYVLDKTLKELKKLNAAAQWPNLHSQHIDIPTLSEVFDLFDEYPDLRMNIEIKDRDVWLANAVGKLIYSKGAENNVLVASGWDSVLKAFRRDHSRVATSASVLEILTFQVRDDLQNGSRRFEPDALQWHSRFWGTFPVITRSFVKKAKSLNLVTHAWTVNREKEMKRMTELGIDAIITDKPSRLMTMLGRLPAASIPLKSLVSSSPPQKKPAKGHSAGQGV